MRITRKSTDRAILSEIGERVSKSRLGRNLTQAELGNDAGVSKRTVERLESGRSVQLTSLIRILRALGLADGIEALVPEPGPSPMQQIKLRGRERKRASRSGKRGDPEPWTWNE